jgi:hypothetical protein
MKHTTNSVVDTTNSVVVGIVIWRLEKWQTSKGEYRQERRISGNDFVVSDVTSGSLVKCCVHSYTLKRSNEKLNYREVTVKLSSLDWSRIGGKQQCKKGWLAWLHKLKKWEDSNLKAEI